MNTKRQDTSHHCDFATLKLWGRVSRERRPGLVIAALTALTNFGVLAGCSGADSGGTPTDENGASVSQAVYGGDSADDTTSKTGFVSSVARINNDCNATLINSTMLITAAHCVSDKDIDDVIVTFAQAPGRQWKLSIRPEIYPAWTNMKHMPDPKDIAVLTLRDEVDSSIAEPMQVFLGDPAGALASNTLKQPCHVVSAGSGTRRVGTLVPSWYLDSCGIFDPNCWYYPERYWRTDASTSHAVSEPGDSGGGLFCKVNGNDTLIGVVSGGGSDMRIYAPTGGDQPDLRTWLTDKTKPTFTRAPSMSVDTYALYAKGELKINDRVKVRSETSGGPYAASSGLSSSSRIGADTVTGDTWIKNIVEVGDRARFGTITASGTMTVKRGTSGRIFEANFTLPNWSFDCNYTGKYVASKNLEPDQTGSLPASEDYISQVSLKRNSVLTLGCGKHYFGSLSTDPTSHVRADTSCGPVRICVDGWIDYKGYLDDTDTTELGDILIGYTGGSTVWLGPHVSATVVAPYAKIGLGNEARFYGALFGESIEIMEASSVTYRPFRHAWWE